MGNRQLATQSRNYLQIIRVSESKKTGRSEAPVSPNLVIPSGARRLLKLLACIVPTEREKSASDFFLPMHCPYGTVQYLLLTVDVSHMYVRFYINIIDNVRILHR